MFSHRTVRQLQAALVRSSLSTLAAVALTASFVSVAAAQNAAVALPEIVVSATTIPTPAEQVANSVSVITDTDIQQKQLRTVPDALKSVPGLNVVQTGGPGGQTSVFIRGTNSNHVKVLLDGIDMGDPSTPNGAFDFAHLLAGDIARIEVLRGPQSGLYGSDAIGGVISITTKKGEGPPKATGMVEGGSFATFNQTAALSGSQGAFNYAFNVLHYQSTSVPVTPLDLLAPGQRRNNDSYNNWTYSTRLGVDVSDDLSLNLIARYIDARLGFTGEDFLNFFPPAPESFQSTQLNHQLFSRGEVVWNTFGGRLKNHFGVNYSNQWSWNFDPNPDSFFISPVVSPPTTNVGERTKFDWRGDLQLAEGHVLVLGLEDQIDKLRTDSTGTVDAGGTFAPMLTTARTGNKAGFAELQSEFAKRVFLVANIRYDDNQSFGPHTTWRIAPAVIVPGSETKLKATYGTGFKAPTLFQLFVSNPSFLFVGNPNLHPERSKGYDAGFEQPLLDGKLRLGATYFHNDITNLINGTFDPTTFISSWANVGHATTYGVESFAAVVVNKELSIRADSTITRTRDESTGLGLLRRPGHKESVSAIWTPVDDLSLTGTLLHVGRWVDISRDGSIPRIDAPAYTTMNVAVDYKVDQHVTAFGRIDNLFNYRYQSPIGFEHTGLGVYGGLRVTN